MIIDPNRYYIVRANTAGVFFGKIKETNGKDSVTMSDVRKLWFWDGAASVEQLAVDGVMLPDRCKFTVSVDEMEIVDPIQLIPCTDSATSCIKAVRPWKI